MTSSSPADLSKLRINRDALVMGGGYFPARRAAKQSVVQALR